MKVKQKHIIQQFRWVLYFPLFPFSFYLCIGWSGSGRAPRSPRASWTIWPQRKHGQRWIPGPPRRAGKRANMAHPHSCTLILSPVMSSCFKHDSDTSGGIFFFTRCYTSHGDTVYNSKPNVHAWDSFLFSFNQRHTLYNNFFNKHIQLNYNHGISLSQYDFQWKKHQARHQATTEYSASYIHHFKFISHDQKNNFTYFSSLLCCLPSMTTSFLIA